MSTPPRKNRAAGTPSTDQRSGTRRPASLGAEARSAKAAAGPAAPDGDSDMTGTYVRVVILEAVIIAALWMLGRAFS